MKNIDFQSMSSFDFVKFVAALFRSRGFQTHIPDDDDYGTDLVIAAGNGLDRESNGLYSSQGHHNRMVVRCVLNDGAVGPFPIAVIRAAQHMYGARIAAVATNGDFTPPAFELARALNVRMISRWRLRHMYAVSQESTLPKFPDMPDKHTCCGLCYSSAVTWNDDGIERMCSACAESVQGREGKVVTAASDTDCAYCKRSIFAGTPAYSGSTEVLGREVLYCTSGKCRAGRLMDPTAK